MSGTILNPATHAVIADQATHSKDDARRAVELARVGQREWAARSVRDRSSVLKKLQPFIVEHADRISRVISDCTGKPRMDALAAEVLPAAIMTDYYTRKAARFLRSRRSGTSSLLFINKRNVISYEPYGVVGIISPWNYPLGIPLHDIISGLLAGNAVLLKVATQVQPVGEIINEMMRSIELPADLFHLLHLPGREAGEGMLDAGIDKLFFTGSNPVGRELAQAAGKRLIPISLELGGNDPMIVLEDANIPRAAAGAIWAGLSNAGQSCGAAERFYVMDQVYDEFLTCLTPMVADLRTGHDLDYQIDMGALTTSRQVETVTSHLSEALADGAREVVRSRVSAAESNKLPNVHPAVVVEDAGRNLSLMKHETFGPILAIQRVSSHDEAVELANDSYLGLGGSVWTSNRKTAKDIAGRMQVGTVAVNDHLMSHGMPETPWGGVKESGNGRTHGEFGFHEMVRPKVVVHERFPAKRKNIWWHPYGPRVYSAIKATLVLFYGRGLFRRISGLPRILSLLVSRMFGRS